MALQARDTEHGLLLEGVLMGIDDALEILDIQVSKQKKEIPTIKY